MSRKRRWRVTTGDRADYRGCIGCAEPVGTAHEDRCHFGPGLVDKSDAIWFQPTAAGRVSIRFVPACGCSPTDSRASLRSMGGTSGSVEVSVECGGCGWAFIAEATEVEP